MTKDDGVIENYSVKPFVCSIEGQTEENKYHVKCCCLKPWSSHTYQKGSGNEMKCNEMMTNILF